MNRVFNIPLLISLLLLCNLLFSQTENIPSFSIAPGTNKEYSENQTVSISSEYSLEISKYLKKNKVYDSVALRVFVNHPEWKKSHVVINLSPDMYGNSGMVILWNSVFPENEVVENISFYNMEKKQKGYSKGGVQDIINVPGSDSMTISRILKKYCKNNQEVNTTQNTVEVLLRTMSKAKDCNDIVLITDDSYISDMHMVDNVSKPVHVIMCRTKNSSKVNPQLLDLAYRTKGSLHVGDYDLTGLEKIDYKQKVEIGDELFELSLDGNFKPFKLNDPLPERKAVNPFVEKCRKANVRQNGKCTSCPTFK
ncbi:MAG: hypothetical protein Q8880_01420 [Bacteroidota bacterium]|nr:hypothetical protein [Bacteroidota bacterium]